MTRTILFIHGGWVTPACWEPFVSFFEARGYRCLAPAWPGKDRSVEAIRADPSPLAGLGIEELVDHYARIVRSLDEPPILIGHSFGGLFVQLLVDRGLGAAGIAIDSAPPKGVFAFEPTTLLSLGRTLLTPFGWRKVVRWSFTEFRYAFVHTMSPDAARAIWDAQIVPDSGRPFFQSGFSMLDRSSPTRVDFANPDRAPLLFIAGEADRAMPPAIVRRMYRAHCASPARTDLRLFPGRTHWLIAQEGWEEVAQACLDWIESLSAVPQERTDEQGTRHGEGTFDGARGARLYHQWWRPEGAAPRAAVIAVHGFGAHSDLLAPLGVYLAQRGYACYAMDLRGHGRSAGRRGDVRAWREFRDDLDAQLRLVAAREGGIPLFLLGASAGALAVLDYALAQPAQPAPPDLCGVVVQAPPLGRLGVSPLRQALARALARVWPTFAVPLGQDLDAVSRDPAVVRELRADSRLLTKATARFSVALLDAAERVNARPAALSVPLLILHGTADRMAAVDGSRRFHERVAHHDKELREYDGGYHDLFHDPDTARVLADLDAWLARHVAPQPPDPPIGQPLPPVAAPSARPHQRPAAV